MLASLMHTSSAFVCCMVLIDSGMSFGMVFMLVSGFSVCDRYLAKPFSLLFFFSGCPIDLHISAHWTNSYVNEFNERARYHLLHRCLTYVGSVCGSVVGQLLGLDVGLECVVRFGPKAVISRVTFIFIFFDIHV